MHPKSEHINYRRILWVLIIFLLPFDSSPFAPGGVIRPLSIYPALAYFLLYFKLPFKIKRTSLHGTIAVIGLIVYTLFTNIIFFHTIMGFLKFLYNVLFISIYGFIIWDYLNVFTKENSISQFWKDLTRLWVFASIFPCFMGLMQLIFINFLDRGIIDSITSLLVYKTTGRIQLTFGEQTFSVIYLLLSIVLVYSFFPKRLSKYFILLIYAFLFLASASTYGFMVVVISLIVYVVVFRVKAFFKMVFFGAITVLILVSIFQYLPEYTQNRLLTIQEIFKNYEVFLQVASNDDSIFLRIVNPFIAIVSLKYTYFVGTGGDSFGYIYPEILLEKFSYVANNPQIKPIVEGEIRTTPKNMYAKLLAEFGIVIGGYMLYRISTFIKRIKGHIPFELITVLILALWLQFDAYFYPIFIFLIVPMLYTVKPENREQVI